jgi:lipoprotein-releasing system ATP-binding protein
MSPRLVLADEPTGNLDQNTSDEIHNLLLELNEETGATFLIATHNYALARLMRRHLIQRDGIIAELTDDEVRERNRLGELAMRRQEG